MSLSFLYIFNFVDFLSSFIKVFVVVCLFYCCFLFFLKDSLSLLGCLPCWGFRVFGFWPSQLGFAVWNVITIIIIITIISASFDYCKPPPGGFNTERLYFFSF